LQDAADLVSHAVTELTAAGMSRQQVAAVLPKLLTKVALARGSSDNVTVLVMDLQAGSSSNSSSSSDDSPRYSSSSKLATAELPVADAAAAAAASKDSSSASTEDSVNEAAASVADVCVRSRRSSVDAEAVLNAAAAERMKEMIRKAAADARAKAAAEAPAALPHVAAAAAADAAQRQSTPQGAAIAAASPFAVASAAAGTRVAAAAATATLAAAAAAVSKVQLLQHSKSAPAPFAKQQQPADAAAAAQHAPSVYRVNCRSRSMSTTVSPFAVAAAERAGFEAGAAAAAALQPLGCDLDNSLASPFFNMQRASLAQVWRAWSDMQQTNSSSTSSGSAATGVFGLLAPAAVGVGLSGQKRRMVTTESPALALDAGLSAPAKLQRGQDGLGFAVLSEAQQRWVAAAERANQLAMQVNA
jgi:hypothetical protein